MRKNTVLIFTRILYILFGIGTIVILWMSYRGTGGSGALGFGIAYLFLTLFLLVYIPFITILNLRKLKWVETKKRLFKFMGLFILFGVLNYAFDYFFRPSSIDLFREFSTALGLSFGISFIDITLCKRKY